MLSHDTGDHRNAVDVQEARLYRGRRLALGSIWVLVFSERGESIDAAICGRNWFFRPMSQVA
jgi:hypothetical protein